MIHVHKWKKNTHNFCLDQCLAERMKKGTKDFLIILALEIKFIRAVIKIELNSARDVRLKPPNPNPNLGGCFS